MLCQECHNAPASVHVKKKQGDEEFTLHLCRACAKRIGWNNPLDDVKFPLAQFIASMMNDMNQSTPDAEQVDTSVKCSECGLSFQEFSRTGRLGCGHCYEAFRPSMQELLRRIHGGTRHQGRRPQKAPAPAKSPGASGLRQLKAELDRAIASEDFEKAARLRDQIRTMKKPKSREEATR